jgi:hypothetical protein
MQHMTYVANDKKASRHFVVISNFYNQAQLAGYETRQR